MNYITKQNLRKAPKFFGCFFMIGVIIQCQKNSEIKWRKGVFEFSIDRSLDNLDINTNVLIDSSFYTIDYEKNQIVIYSANESVKNIFLDSLGIVSLSGFNIVSKKIVLIDYDNELIYLCSQDGLLIDKQNLPKQLAAYRPFAINSTTQIIGNDNMIMVPMHYKSSYYATNLDDMAKFFESPTSSLFILNNNSLEYLRSTGKFPITYSSMYFNEFSPQIAGMDSDYIYYGFRTESSIYRSGISRNEQKSMNFVPSNSIQKEIDNIAPMLIDSADNYNYIVKYERLTAGYFLTKINFNSSLVGRIYLHNQPLFDENNLLNTLDQKKRTLLIHDLKGNLKGELELSKEYSYQTLIPFEKGFLLMKEDSNKLIFDYVHLD